MDARAPRDGGALEGTTSGRAEPRAGGYFCSTTMVLTVAVTPEVTSTTT